MRLLDMLRTTFRNRHRIDVVLIDTYSTANFYFALAVGRLCRLYRIPYIPILRGGNLPARIENSARLSRPYFTNALANVAPSMYLFEQFKEEKYLNLVHIPNNIPISNYGFKARPGIAYKLLWVRSFAKIYNPMMAVHVVSILSQKGFSVELCMVGPDKDGTMEVCKTATNSKNLPIQFPGVLAKADWIHLAKDYDIFINTTDFDNTPVSVMEAMALGLPIVTTRVGGIPYLIENDKTGILCPANDPEFMASAIISLVNNPFKAQNIAQKAREVVEQFDWEVVKDQWTELIDGIKVSRVDNKP